MNIKEYITKQLAPRVNREVISVAIMIVFFLLPLVIIGQQHLNDHTDGNIPAPTPSIEDTRLDDNTIKFLEREGLTAAQLRNPHTQAYWNCSRYYEIPCDENGELRTDLTEGEINALFESDQRGDSHLTQFEINYLKKLSNGTK